MVTFFVVGIMGVVTTPKKEDGGRKLEQKKNDADLFIILDCGLACVVFAGIVLSGYLLGEQLLCALGAYLGLDGFKLTLL